MNMKGINKKSLTKSTIKTSKNNNGIVYINRKNINKIIVNKIILYKNFKVNNKNNENGNTFFIGTDVNSKDICSEINNVKILDDNSYNKITNVFSSNRNVINIDNNLDFKKEINSILKVLKL